MLISREIMFLYPIWILFAGAPVVLFAGLLGRNRLIPPVMSFFITVSGASILIPYLFFRQPRVIASLGGFFNFSLDAFTVAGALCVCALCAGCIPWLLRDNDRPGRLSGEAFVLANLGLAVGTMLASDLMTLLLFAEASYVLFFGAARRKGSAVRDALFLAPAAAVVIGLFFFWNATGTGRDAFLAGLPGWLPFILAGYVLYRLFFIPLSFSSNWRTRIAGEPLLALLAIISLYAEVFLMMRVLLASSVSPGALGVLLPGSLAAAVIYLVIASRQKDPGKMAVCILFIVTACITGTACIRALVPAGGNAVAVMACSTLAAAAGLIFVAGFEKAGGRAISVLFVVFAAALAGLLPIAGLVGRIALYRSVAGEGGYVSIIAFVLLGVSLLPALLLARFGPFVTNRSAGAARGVSAGEALSLGIILFSLYLPVLCYAR